METTLRAVCVVTCVLSGVYSLLLFTSLIKQKKEIIRYSALCFVFAFHANFEYAAYPMHFFENIDSAGLIGNIFLFSLCMIALFLNQYGCNEIQEKNPGFFNIYNYICLGLSAISFALPSSHFLIAYIIGQLLCLYSSILTVINSYLAYKKNRSINAFALLSQIILCLSYIPDTILLIVKIEFFSARIICFPVYLILISYMLTLIYKESNSRTASLAESLSKTIESIKNSDNALMCTQIKQEFLYGTLDLIGEKCESDPDTAEFLTISLSKYLRHTLNFQQLKGIVPLSNEIELIKAYISIEKAKYPGIVFEYRFPDDMPEFFIPPLSIQPLIENSIEHGIANNGGEGRITLTIMQFKDFFQIDVSDTGAGISPDLLKRLPDGFTKTARIGLFNINSRLVSLFQKGLVLQSAPGLGTSVSFVVPPDARKYLEEANKNEE